VVKEKISQIHRNHLLLLIGENIWVEGRQKISFIAHQYGRL
jgi:hypothetical protein